MTILSGWHTTAMWQRQRASKSHWCEKNWNLRECSNCGMAWRGMAWHGVAWRGMAWRGMAWHGGDGWLPFSLLLCASERLSVSVRCVCVCICLCVCGWRRLHTSMLMLGWQRRLSSTFSLLFPVPWQAGSGRVSLVRFGILGRHFAEGRGKKGSCLRVEAFLAGIWVWEQLLCECMCVCVCAGVWVLKLLPSTAPIRSKGSNNKQGNRNNNYGHLGLGDVIFFFS